jgi:predicted N-acetyltransferase YhbS
MTIRCAQRGDAPAIAHVNMRAWRVAYRGLVPRAILDGLSTTERERRFRDHLDEDGRTAFTLVAERDGRLIGFCRLLTPTRDADAAPRTAEVAGLYVDPDWWRSGTGSALLAAALDRLVAGEWREVTLWVFAGNDSARAFYERHGFRPDGAEARHERTGLAMVRMRASLDGRML